MISVLIRLIFMALQQTRICPMKHIRAFFIFFVANPCDKKACRLRHAAPLLRRVSDKIPLQKRAHPRGAFFTL